jgi:uncharacterized protein (DUF697 family)
MFGTGIELPSPLQRIIQNMTQWLVVDPEKVSAILAEVRQQLPTTEALLLGKAQSGKSSIVRGLTGVTADIIGQGFVPHTQFTQQYAYPSTDLPLLLFTDTVGLGDATRDSQTQIEQLMDELRQANHRARILVLTVKINDFATEGLRQLAQQLRQNFPEIPCVLALTCLHEVYPPALSDHPPYPPELSDIIRAQQQTEQIFAGICDRTILIDFTLETDGYTPQFYGLETLRDTLADLLPEAESKAIHQLLDGSVSDQLSQIYREVGRRYSTAFAVIAAAIATVPLPFSTMLVLTTLQASMIALLGQVYGQTLTLSQAGGVISAIAGGFLAQTIGRELIKFIPGFGSVVAASWASAYTWALGEGACVYFGDLMGGKKPDPKKIQAAMKSAFQEAQTRFKATPQTP